MQVNQSNRCRRRLLVVFLSVCQMAAADTVTMWTGGQAPCPTCWSNQSNWNPSSVPNNNVSVVINAGGSQPILDTTANGYIVDNLTLGSGATLGVANGQALGINTANTGGVATLLNGGTLSLNSTGTGTYLQLLGTGGTVNLNGAGALTLSPNANNYIYAGSGGMTLNNNSTIQGSGQIGTLGSALALYNNSGGVINANQNVALTLGGTVTNAGLLEATSGGALSLTGVTVNNGSGIISASGAGSAVLLSGTTINGGTAQAGSGGQLTQSGGYSTLTGTVALNGVLNVNNGSGLNLSAAGGPLTLNLGTGAGINLNSTGNATDVAFSGTNGTINLNGPVTFSNNVNNRIYANSTGMTLNNSSTIQGAGQIGVVGNGLIVNNTGAINANQSTALTLNGTITNTSGLLEATNGGTLILGGSVNNTGSTISASGANTNLQLTGVNIANSGGNISLNGAGSVGTLNGASINGGTLQATNGAAFTQSGSYSTLTGTVALNGVLNVSNGSGIYLNAAGGPMTLNIGSGGGVNLNSTGNATDLAFIGTNGVVNLNGPVTLSNNANNRIYANSAGMTLNNNSTIQGSGQIGLVGNPLAFNNNASGVVNSNQSSGLSLGGNVLNAGLLEATNGATLSLAGTNVNNTAGTISAAGAGSTVLLNGTSINGGVLQTGNGGLFTQSGGYSTLSGTVALNGVLNVNNSSGLNLNTIGGPMTLNMGSGGGINLNSNGNATDLAFTGTNGVVNLNGPVTLSNNANNRIYANSAGMTLNNNFTIQGAGQIGVVGSNLILNNTGTINANQSAGLTINGTIRNTAGLLEATNGATLSLSGSVNNTGSSISATGANTNLQLTGLTVTNTNGTISLNGAGSVGTLNGTTIAGGTLQATNGASFTQTGSYSNLSSAVALNGVLNINNSSGLYLNAPGGTMALNIGGGGGLNLNSTGNTTDLAIQGTGGAVFLNGPVTLSNNANNRIYANSAGMTLNSSSTIQGAGQIGVVGSNLILNNTGTIDANQSAGLTINGTITNTAGLLEATNGATLSLSGSVNNTGSSISATGANTNLQLTGLTVTNTNGTISLNGAGSVGTLNGTTIAGGTLQATNGASFTQTGSYSNLSSAVALNGVLNINNSSGLYLNAPGGTMALNIGGGGGLNLNSTGNTTDLAIQGTGGAVFLNGPVTMSNNANNRIYANSAGMTLFNNSTIQGAGQIGLVGSRFVFSNTGSGVVNSNLSSGLSLGTTVANQGLLEATNGSTLSLSNATITNSAGIMSASGAGSTVLLNNTTINGGTFQTFGGGQFTQTGSYSTLSGTVALNGVLNVNNSSGLNLNAASLPLTLNFGSNGGINLNSTGNVTDLALAGTNGIVNLNGPVTMSNNANNRIYANSGGMTLNNGGVIQGSGQIGVVGASLIFNNNGVLSATQSTPLTIGAAKFTNNGEVETASGATLNITSSNFTNFGGNTLTGGSYFNGGIIEFNNANIVDNAASIYMSGPAAEIKDQNGLDALRGFDDNQSGGVFDLENGFIFTTPGGFSNDGTVDVFATDLFGIATTYTQTGGSTQVDGVLAADAESIDGGVLKGTGTVEGNVTVTGGGAVDPGDSPGTLTVSGNYTQTGSGILNLEFGGAGAGQFDVLDISGAANLNGTLNLAALAGFTPSSGEIFDVMNFASRAGTFSSVNGLDLGNGFTFQLEYNPTNVLLEVEGPQSATPEPGSWLTLGIGVFAIALSRWIRRACR